MTDEDREMRDVDFVVCIPAAGGLMFPDNVVAVCSHCGRSIQHRPSVPREAQKVCHECGAAKMREGANLRITKRQLREFAAALKRQRH